MIQQQAPGTSRANRRDSGPAPRPKGLDLLAVPSLMVFMDAPPTGDLTPARPRRREAAIAAVPEGVQGSVYFTLMIQLT